MYMHTHNITETHGYMREYQWVHVVAYKWGNMAAEWFILDISANESYFQLTAEENS